MANIGELHAEVARLVKQIRDLAVVINKMGSKPNIPVPPSEARPIPRSVPQRESWLIQKSNGRYSPSPDYFEEDPGNEDIDYDPGDENIDEDEGMRDVTSLG